MNKIKLNQYIINAFTNIVFKGNPAAVCVLDSWLSDEILLKITQENNLSETAFVVQTNDKYHLRWFTPGGEIDLCGHATLATAFVYLNYIIPNQKEIAFETLSGVLTVTLKDDLYTMDFPSYDLKKVDVTAKGDKVDCVSRTFAPKCNILEDPVCGSGHCHIIPYWAKILQKDKIVAYQDSFRGGYLYTKLNGNRIKLSGKAVLFSKCEIYLDL